MTTYTFQVKFYQGNQNRIIVPYQYMEAFQSVNTMQYGPNHCQIECLVHHKDNHTIYIASRLKFQLHFTNNQPITVHINKQNCIILLTLGVFIAGFQSGSAPLGERTEIFEQLSLAGEKNGFQTLFFGHQHYSINDNTIFAYYYQNKRWRQKDFPLPEVIYNRLPNRQIEHHPLIKKVKKQLIKQALLFNDSFFNKWEIYEQLMRSQDCSYLLPETVLHPTPKKIANMIEKYSIYIKPIHGSLGNGIVKCSLLPNGEIQSHYYIQNKAQINRYMKIESFFRQHFPNGLEGYVAQKEIPLLKTGNNPIDFRVHTNKNQRNSWEATLICAKFAGKGSLTTHVKRGGQLHVLEELFSKEEAKRIQQRLTTTALLVSSCLEKNCKKPLGELGFDFGIDPEGKVWLFEANSKPGYSVFEHPLIKQKTAQVLSYPFLYAFYLLHIKNNTPEHI